MIKNYFKIAWRNIARYKSFSLINIIGLAVSMSVCLLIIMVIADQYSYDSYHTKADRIYRIHSARVTNLSNENASSALPLAAKLRNEYPIVEKAVGLNKQIGGDLIYEGKYASGGGYFTESELFDIMDFDFKEGDPSTALDNPFSMVITHDIADQLFPDESALGKTIEFHDKGILAMGIEGGSLERDFGIFKITGVINIPSGKTHLPFKLLASQNTMKPLAQASVIHYDEDNWFDVWTNYTYVLLREGQRQADLQLALDGVAEEVYSDTSRDQFAYLAAPLSGITPSGLINNATHISVPKMVLVVLSVLCMVVMVSACLNYTYLSIARTLTRTKEVGVRKSFGAKRPQIFVQFIVEAVVISLVSLLFAFGLLLVLQQGFSGLWLNGFLNITFEHSLILAFVFIGFSVLVGFVAGFLPAVYVSRLSPVHLFQRFSGLKIFKRMGVRKTLLVVQFSFSMIFIITILLIRSQAAHLLDFDYGFDKENVLTVKLYNPENYDRFAQAISSVPQVKSIGAASLIPAGGTNMGGMAVDMDAPEDSVYINYMDVNASVIAVWNLEIIAGKNLPEMAIENQVLLNEEAVKNFHFESDREAIGKQLVVEGQHVEVVGVVKDFHFLTPDRQIESLVMRNRESQFGFAMIKLFGNSPSESVAAIEKVWKEVNPSTSFDCSYLDDELLLIHSMLTDVMYVIGMLSMLAIFISCLGLLGMAAYTAQTRVKEIGIRKALGSTSQQIVVLLSKGFFRLLLIAVVISVPIAYFINDLWLNFFASRVSINPLIIGLAVAGVLSVSLLMVLSQAYRAARANPIKSLQNE